MRDVIVRHVTWFLDDLQKRQRQAMKRAFGRVARSSADLSIHACSGPPVVKAAAGSGRANDIIKLPGDDRIHVKVATEDSGGTLFMTQQPIERRGSHRECWTTAETVSDISSFCCRSDRPSSRNCSTLA